MLYSAQKGIRRIKLIYQLNKTQHNHGFTLLELMITVAIVAIIASIAIPSYMDYTKRTHYSELVRATAPYKLGVVHCYNTYGSFDHCNSSTVPNSGIPPSINTPPNQTSAIGKITVDKGVITAEPNPMYGLTAEQKYLLKPSASNGVVYWTASGKGVDDGLTSK